MQVFRKIGGKDMLEALVYTVIYGSRPLKREAAYALEEIEDISVLPDLQKALKRETDMNTKEAILRAVNKLKEIKMDKDFKKAIQKEREEKLKKTKQSTPSK